MASHTPSHGETRRLCSTLDCTCKSAVLCCIHGQAILMRPLSFWMYTCNLPCVFNMGHAYVLTHIVCCVSAGPVISNWPRRQQQLSTHSLHLACLPAHQCPILSGVASNPCMGCYLAAVCQNTTLGLQHAEPFALRNVRLCLSCLRLVR